MTQDQIVILLVVAMVLFLGLSVLIKTIDTKRRAKKEIKLIKDDGLKDIIKIEKNQSIKEEVTTSEDGIIDEKKSLEEKTVEELKNICRQNNIVGFSKLTKNELVEKIINYSKNMDEYLKNMQKIYMAPIENIGTELGKLTVDELKFICGQHEITGYNKLTKDKLVRKILDRLTILKD